MKFLKNKKIFKNNDFFLLLPNLMEIVSWEQEFKINFEGFETQAPILELEFNIGKSLIFVFLIFSKVSKFKVSGFKSMIIEDRSL